MQPTMQTSFAIPPATPSVIVQLLKGVLYSERHEDLWRDMIAHQAAVRGYCAIIGLQLVIDEAEGYAFLRQAPLEEQDSNTDLDRSTPNLPRLITRRPLSYGQSLLCVLLRKKLAEQDAGGGSTRLVLHRAQIIDMVQVFLPDSANEAKRADHIGRHINRLVDYGFLRPLKGEDDAYEVRRIIKALVDADWLASLDEKLSTYQRHADAIA